jgi:hypothetical protein
LGGANLALAGVAVTAAGATLGIAAVYGGVSSGAAVAAVGGILVAAPALFIGGIVRANNNSKVNKEIVRRHTALPVYLGARNGQRLDVFFALAPSPSHLELTYSDAQGVHVLAVDTRQALAGLHLGTSNTTPAENPH